MPHDGNATFVAEGGETLPNQVRTGTTVIYGDMIDGAAAQICRDVRAADEGRPTPLTIIVTNTDPSTAVGSHWFVIAYEIKCLA